MGKNMNIKNLPPSRRLLPDISIMEKLKALRPEAESEIFNAFQRIAERRRAEAAESTLVTGLKESLKLGFSNAVFFYFRPLKNLRDTVITPKTPHDAAHVAMERDWSVTGDDLRAAINDYIETHNLADALSLTEKERKSLDYVARNYTPYCTRRGPSAFTI